MSISNRRVPARVRTAITAVAAAALVTLGTLVAAGTSASAQVKMTPVAAAVGVSPASREIQDVPEVGVCTNCAPPLLYRGGPAMGSSLPTGTITVTPIYWSPTGLPAFSSVDPGYVALNNRYLTDIAAASNTTGNVYSILPDGPVK